MSKIERRGTSDKQSNNTLSRIPIRLNCVYNSDFGCHNEITSRYTYLYYFNFELLEKRPAFFSGSSCFQWSQNFSIHVSRCLKSAKTDHLDARCIRLVDFWGFFFFKMQDLKTKLIYQSFYGDWLIQ